MTLKTGFSDRPATVDDLEAVVDLFNGYWEPLLGRPDFSSDGLRQEFTAPGFDLATSTRVVLAPDESIAGCIYVADFVSLPLHPFAQGCVRTGFEGQGIGTYLLGWAEERARRALDRVPDGVRVGLRLYACREHEPTRHLFGKLGFGAIRSSLVMAVDLDQAPPKVEWPAGIMLRTFREHPDVGAVWRAVDEAFRDHWGHVDVGEEEGIRQWQHRLENDAEFDPSLWFLAMDGPEIAGMALCDPSVGGDEGIGWVDRLGVRRPWRRKGLALQLLRHAFSDFRSRGRRRVELEVDSGSLTGATRLYERAGMRATAEIFMYEKELRAGEELGTQSL